MQLTYTIDDYWRLRTMSPVEAPIDAKSRSEALYHPDDSENDLGQDIQPTGTDGRWSMSSEVAVRRIWKQFRRFLLFLCFLFFSSLHLLFGSWHGTNGVSMGLYHLPMEVEFPRAPDPPKGCHWVYWSVVGLMGLYDCVRRMILSFLVSLFLTSLILALAAQEVCA